MFFNGIGGVGFSITKTISLNAEFTYNKFEFNESKFLKTYGFEKQGIHISKGSATIMSIMGMMKAERGVSLENIYPYVLIGLGCLQFSIDDINVRGRNSLTIKGDSQYRFGGNIGVGIESQFDDNIFIFLEARYFVGITKKEFFEYLPIHLGIHFSFPFQGQSDKN